MNSFQYQNFFEFDSRTHFFVLKLQINQFTNLLLIIHSFEFMQSFICTNLYICHSFEFMQFFIHLNLCNHLFIRIHAIIYSFEFMQSFIRTNSCNFLFIWIRVIIYLFEFMQSFIHLNLYNYSFYFKWFFFESTFHNIWFLIFLTIFDRIFFIVRISFWKQFES